jgi:hypothetical protein
MGHPAGFFSLTEYRNRYVQLPQLLITFDDQAVMPYVLKLIVLLVLSSVLTVISRAQQFATDDAAIVNYLSFQLEAWHGEKSSWILPAVQPMRGLEITPGVGWVLDDGSRKTEFVLQGKYLFILGDLGVLAVFFFQQPAKTKDTVSSCSLLS